VPANLQAAVAPLALVLVSWAAWGSDCAVSREFEIRRSQVLRGTLQDPQGLALSGTRIELLAGKLVVQSRKTDRLGEYDFGEVSSGRYRVKVHAFAFCAPEVVCKADGCSLRSKLKLNPQKPR
jgi:hypothetical protein